MKISSKHIEVFKSWQTDWNKFARDVLKVTLDPEQQIIITAVQNSPLVSVCSGTARGKDFTAAVAAICFMYLTPKWNHDGELIKNTKVALTAPTGRQVGDIMYPEISRLFNRAKVLPGRLVGFDIRTEYDEWFLTGFKADEHNKEAWTGFHASNTMFVVTEASGIPETIFDSIEGNLQGNSRLLIIFNPNVPTGYAARSQKSTRFKKFRLDSLTSPNVTSKKEIIPGQVDWQWVNDKVDSWCVKIDRKEFNEGEGDFEWEGNCYRPNDLFRIKVRGMFPKVSEDVLVPLEWMELANKRWEEWRMQGWNLSGKHLIGVDIAGMGRDSSVFCHRHEMIVSKFERYQSAGSADHMKMAGVAANHMNNGAISIIDTIGEGAGVYSRLEELGYKNAISCKFSESAAELKDVTGIYEFANMRAFCYWAVRDWLNPENKTNAALPPNDLLTEELTETKWKFRSDGKIIIEPKEDIKERIGRSPDDGDALANTFYPHVYAGGKGMTANELIGFL